MEVDASEIDVGNSELFLTALVDPHEGTADEEVVVDEGPRLDMSDPVFKYVSSMRPTQISRLQRQMRDTHQPGYMRVVVTAPLRKGPARSKSAGEGLPKEKIMLVPSALPSDICVLRRAEKGAARVREDTRAMLERFHWGDRTQTSRAATLHGVGDPLTMRKTSRTKLMVQRRRSPQRGGGAEDVRGLEEEEAVESPGLGRTTKRVQGINIFDDLASPFRSYQYNVMANGMQSEGGGWG